jgi:amidohydrolase
MESIERIKQDIIAAAEEKKAEFEETSSYIFAHPELSFEEHKSQAALCELLEKHGFRVTRGLGSLPTAFEAVYDSGLPGKTVALMGEYDCLPEIGHGCGHNLIGTSAAGAGIVLKETMEKYGIGGVLKVLGTPAEENGSGKAIMVREGAFEGIDAALLMHPMETSVPDDISFACVAMEFTFKGKPAHAAACPWDGANALSGVQLMFHAVDMMRLHFRDYSRVHGIITEGGTAHNTVSDEAKAVFNIRALDYEYMMKLVEIIRNCAKGAATATGTSVEEKQLGEIVKDIRNDKRLVQYVRSNMELIGEEYIERDLTQGIGSTDVGNVTHEIPSIQFYVKLKEHVGTHTKEFALAAGGEEGRRNLHTSVQLLALSACDVLMEE